MVLMRRAPSSIAVWLVSLFSWREKVEASARLRSTVRGSSGVCVSVTFHVKWLFLSDCAPNWILQIFSFTSIAGATSKLWKKRPRPAAFFWHTKQVRFIQQQQKSCVYFWYRATLLHLTFRRGDIERRDAGFGIDIRLEAAPPRLIIM